MKVAPAGEVGNAERRQVGGQPGIGSSVRAQVVMRLINREVAVHHPPNDKRVTFTCLLSIVKALNEVFAPVKGAGARALGDPGR